MSDEEAAPALPAPPVDGGPRLPLSGHFAELRLRVAVGCGALVLALLLGAAFYRELWTAIRLPLAWAAADLGRKPEELVSFFWIGPLAGFTAMVRISLILALILALPVIAHQLWCFVAPGLTRRERGVLLGILTAGSLCFLAGAALALRWGAPLALRWLLSFNLTLEGSANQWTLDEYLGFLTLIGTGFGLAFETPLVMLALGRAGLIDDAGLRRTWRHASFAIVVLAAILTPPDPVSQLLLVGVLGLLYAFGWLLVRVAGRSRSAADA